MVPGVGTNYRGELYLGNGKGTNLHNSIIDCHGAWRLRPIPNGSSDALLMPLESILRPFELQSEAMGEGVNLACGLKLIIHPPAP